jgi:hypothetical protein
MVITGSQFDRALLEQIQHARGMNVPINAVSSAAMFTMLVGNRLFGERPQEAHSPEFQRAFKNLVQDAIDERARIKAEEMRDQQRQQQQKAEADGGVRTPGGIIIPRN